VAIQFEWVSPLAPPPAQHETVLEEAPPAVALASASAKVDRAESLSELPLLPSPAEEQPDGKERPDSEASSAVTPSPPDREEIAARPRSAPAPSLPQLEHDEIACRDTCHPALKSQSSIRALYVLAARHNGSSLRQIAENFGFSKERARQLSLHGLRVVRSIIAKDAGAGLSARTRNALLTDGCEPTPDAVVVRYRTVWDLRRVPNMGKKSIAELQAWLVHHGKAPVPCE
jgi:hypothetical protein